MPTVHDDADRQLASLVGILGVGGGGLGADMSLTGSNDVPYMITQRGVGAALTSEPMPSVYIARRANQNQTEEVNDALNEAPSRTVILGGGTFIVDPDSIICEQPQVGIEGQGNYASKFSLTGGGVALTFNNGSTDMVRNFVRRMGFTSPDTTQQKVAIDAIGVTQFELDSVTIGTGGTWTGAGSIGLRCAGHEFGWVSRFAAMADAPILVTQNPYSSIDLDHWDFNNCYLIANGHPCFEIADGCNLTSNRLTGHAWVAGTHGFYYNDTTTVGFGGLLSIEDVRWEQAAGGAGYTVYFAHNTGFRHLNLTRVWSGSTTTVKGFFIRKAHNTAIRSCSYLGTLESLNVNGAGMDLLTIDSTNSLGGSTRAMTGMTRIFAAGKPADTNEPSYNTEVWVSNSANLPDSVVTYNTKVTLTAQSAAIGSTVILSGPTPGLYRLTYYHEITRAATSSSSTQVTFGWTAAAASSSSGVAITSNVVGDVARATQIIRVASGDITYSTSYASSGATTMQYGLAITVERLS